MAARILTLLAVALSSSGALAQDSSWDLAGSLALESRFFTQDARWPGQPSGDANMALSGQAELRWRSDDNRQRVSVIPYARWDQNDNQRSLVDLREAYWAWEGEDFEILVGMNTVFWGVTESVHLVDVVNQTDLAGDIDGEDKLGQPMVNVLLQRNWGALDLYVMPGFRERTFPGTEGRFRPPLPVDKDRSIYTSSAGQDHVDLALRYSHFIGDVDIGVSFFSGTSREARWLPSDDGDALLPVYDVVDQLGIDLQYTRDAWLWKLEGMLRDGYRQTFGAAVGGFEYTLYQLAGTDVDLGLLLEYQYDGRDARQPVTVNDNDVFAGFRLALNDVQDATLLAGLSYDVETDEVLMSVEAERRFGESWVIEMNARFFTGAGPRDTTYPLAQDDYLQLLVSKFF